MQTGAKLSIPTTMTDILTWLCCVGKVRGLLRLTLGVGALPAMVQMDIMEEAPLESYCTVTLAGCSRSASLLRGLGGAPLSTDDCAELFCELWWEV